MAYTKQTWIDDVSAVTGARMTHIEQGIYDNSLATDKINPSGTATTTAEFTDGQINDVIGFKSSKLKGQTSQYTTTGYNLLPPGESGTHTVNGLTHTSDGKGTYTLTGTASSTSRQDWAVEPYTIKSGDYLYLSNDAINNGVTLALLSDASTQIMYTGATTVNRIVSLDNYAGQTINYVRTYSNAQTLTNYKLQPMICDSTSRTTFEQYSGGKASPNPDFPQQVENVTGYNVVEINGSKNLFDKDINIVTPGYLNGNGAVVTSDATLSYQDRFIKVQPSTVYTISSGTNTIYRIAEYTSDKTFITRTLNANASRSYTFTTSSQTHFIKMAGTLTTVLNTLQIEKGNTATSYVAHQGNNFEINLGKQLIQDETFVQGSYLDNTMTIRISCRNIKLKANTTYTISSTLDYSKFNISAATSTSQFPIANDTYMIYNSGWKNANFTFTTGNDDVYINIAVKKLPDGAVITPSDVEGIKFQIEKGANATPYAEYFTPIEICKIGTYQDYIVKKDGKWWKHKEVEKITLNGSETPTINTALTNTTRAFYSNILPYNAKAGAGSGICNLLPYYANWVTDVEGFYLDGNTTNLVFRINKSTVGTTITSVNNFLSENNMTVYYILETAIEEEITYTPLIRQLDELYNSGLYDVTNISQDNSSEAFILDLEACKNNINGIVEYIRR